MLQSDKNFRINDGQMTIQVTVVRLQVGSGRKPLHAGVTCQAQLETNSGNQKLLFGKSAKSTFKI